MSIFRYTSNAWGEKTLEGISWDLLWLFIGVSLTAITIHFFYKLIMNKKIKETL